MSQENHLLCDVVLYRDICQRYFESIILQVVHITEIFADLMSS